MLQAIVDDHWKETPLRAVIGEKEWNIYHNTLTGVVTSRAILAHVAVKRRDGSCSVFNMYFTQPFAGNAWGRTSVSEVKNNEDIACENVGK